MANRAASLVVLSRYVGAVIAELLRAGLTKCVLNLTTRLRFPCGFLAMQAVTYMDNREMPAVVAVMLLLVRCLNLNMTTPCGSDMLSTAARSRPCPG